MGRPSVRPLTLKILLTGSSGQVGFELKRSLAPLGEVLAVDRAGCDLGDEDALRRLIRTVGPDVIVNAGAYTAVDQAESDAATATAVNALAPGVIGREAARLGACVVHFSTDYVFDGTKPSPYLETDTTNPQSVYGRSKRDGELALQASTSQHLIFRTSWVVGTHGSNFAKTILRLAGERESLGVVADQFGVPTPAPLLADVTSKLLARVARDGTAGFPFGLYHLVPSGATTWHHYACFVLEQARAAGRPLRLTADGVRPLTTAEYPTAARRPANSRLDTHRIRAAFGVELPHWQAGIRPILQGII